MRAFRVEAIAQIEFDEAAAWYETQREGLGREFVTRVEVALQRIRSVDEFRTAPILTIANGVVRREFVERFP